MLSMWCSYFPDIAQKSMCKGVCWYTQSHGVCDSTYALTGFCAATGLLSVLLPTERQGGCAGAV